MTPSDNCYNLIKEMEGFRSKVYKDAVGVWTIGYGTTRDEQGKPLTASYPPITEQKALEFLKRDSETFYKGVQSLVTHGLTQGQLDSLTSFAYNLGLGNLGKSTLLKKLNTWDIIGASQEFARWNRAGGQVLNGLTKRRERERQLFLS